MEELEQIEQTYGSLTNSLASWMNQLLSNWGLPHIWIAYIKIVILLLLTVGLVFLLQYLVNHILTYIFKRIVSTTKLSFFQYAINNKLPHYLALVIPYTFVRTSIPIIFMISNHSFPPCIS